VDKGMLSPEEAETHHRRHVLTRALCASRAWGEPDMEWVPLQDGDQVLLCTDGLTGMVDETAIAEVLRRAGTADQACRELVDRARPTGAGITSRSCWAATAFPRAVKRWRACLDLSFRAWSTLRARNDESGTPRSCCPGSHSYRPPLTSSQRLCCCLASARVSSSPGSVRRSERKRSAAASTSARGRRTSGRSYRFPRLPSPAPA
jgi:hypothetical protein